MSFYRVAVLDHHGEVAVSRTSDSLEGAAALLIGLGASANDPWAKPLLDDLGEFTVYVTGTEYMPITQDESARLLELVKDAGGLVPETEGELGRLRWRNPERQT